MARKSTKPTAATRVRSAITGRFVKKNQAKRTPRTTIVELVSGGRKRRKRR